MYIFKKKESKTIDWMLDAGNIFSVETRVLDRLFCKCWGGGGRTGKILKILGGQELAR